MKPVPSNSAPSFDFANFESAYSFLNKTLYKRSFQYILLATFVIMMREALTYQTSTIFGLYPLISCFLLFGISIFKVLDRFKDQEFGYFILGAIILGSSMVDVFNEDDGPMQNPKDSFYYGYGVALFQRILVDKLPNLKYRILLRVACMFVYPLIVSYNQRGTLFVQFMLSALSLYMDTVSESNKKNLFQSYNNYKQQLVKFKNLVENGIPQGISIIKQDLSGCLFGNDAFRKLVKINCKASTRANFSKFFIQNNPENGQPSSQAETQTLLDLIETAKQRWEQGHPDEEFSCNVIYSKCDIKNINNIEEEICKDNIYEAKISQIIWDEQPAIAIMIYDITTQYTVLSLKAADAQKDALLATVSHELRTPLNGMLGMIQVIQKRIKDIEILHYLKICKNSGSLLLSLVNSLLDLNQIQANTIKLYPQRINLEELLNDMVNLFEVQCQQKKIYLKVKLMMSPADKYIFTDQERLSQILINLIGNALKFTSEGGITISVAPSKHHDHVEFSVTDTGVGIKEEDKKKLFQVYGKLDQANSRINQQGVGLGLTISNNLAKLLSNVPELQSIKLESSYGKGSNFHFFVKKRLDFLDNQPNQEESILNTSSNLDESSFMEFNSLEQKIYNYHTPLPKNLESLKGSPINSSSFQDIPLHKTITKALKDSQWSTDASSPSVVIVDDNPFNLIVAEHLVAAQGCKVKTALSGKAAIDLVVDTWMKSEPISLILMDLQMPEMDGYQTTRNLKNLMQTKKIPEIPIVALTANDTEADKRACFESGMKEHLSKPLKEGDLTRILRRYSTADSLPSRSNRKEFKTAIH